MYHGEFECRLKLACLAGKRLNSISGLSSLALLVSVAANRLPETLQAPYAALRDSLMYSDDCQQYICNVQ
mgnify:CR=1 FL=1